MEKKQHVGERSSHKTVNHFIASLERKFRGITLWRTKKIEKTRKNDKWRIFTHEKRWILQIKKEKSIKYQCQSVIHAFTMPVTIKEISFHRSLNNRSIKLFPFSPLHHSGSILTCKLPHPHCAMTFYNHSWNGCSCIIIFMRHFPVS